MNYDSTVLLGVCATGHAYPCSFDNTLGLCMSVDGNQVADKQTAYPNDPQAELIVQCRYDVILSPTLTVRKLGSSASDAKTVGDLDTDTQTLTYTVSEEYRRGTTVYHCFDQKYSSSTIQITVSYDQHPPPSECVWECVHLLPSECVWECVRPPPVCLGKRGAKLLTFVTHISNEG